MKILHYFFAAFFVLIGAFGLSLIPTETAFAADPGCYELLSGGPQNGFYDEGECNSLQQAGVGNGNCYLVGQALPVDCNSITPLLSDNPGGVGSSAPPGCYELLDSGSQAGFYDEAECNPQQEVGVGNGLCYLSGQALPVDCGSISPLLSDNPDGVGSSDVPEEGDVVEQDSCEQSGDGWGWLLCPIIYGSAEVIEEVDQQIIDALEVKEEYYSTPELRAVWSSFRNISYILLIPVLLVMVISTALGFQFVDAYTVKRAMPRLFIAVIFMALSFDICVFLIEFTNNVGNGVGGLVAAPFGGKGALEFTDVFSIGEGAATTATLGVGLVGIVAALAVGIVSISILMSFLFTSALAVIIIFALLSVRELLIIFLIIMAPIAIVSWIFPGNDKLWKLWWSTFSKLLMIFPLIILLLYAGRGFAAVVFTSDLEGLEGVFSLFLKFIAYIGPFFAIPAAFKYLGGAFANLAGMVNDRGKGIFDRQKKFRRERGKKDWERVQQRGLLRPGSKAAKSRFGSRLNSATKSGLALKESLGTDDSLKDKLSAGNRKAAADRLHREHERHAGEDKNVGTKFANDNFVQAYLALARAEGNELEAKIELEKNGIVGLDAEGEIAQARTLYNTYGDSLGGMAAAAKAGSKTSHINGATEMLDDIEVGTHGNTVLYAEAYNQARAAAERGGRYMLSRISFGEGLALAQANRMINASGGDATTQDITYQDEITGETHTIKAGMTKEDINLRMKQKTLDAMGTYDWNNIHPTDAKNLVSMLGADVQEIETRLSQNKYTDSVDEEGRVTQTAGEKREADLRLMGQRIGQMKSMRQNVNATANGEVQRIVANGFDLPRPKTKDENFKFTIDGKDANTLSDLIEAGASWPMVERTVTVVENGQPVTKIVRERMNEADVPPELRAIIEGARSVSREAGMTQEELEMMRRQQESRAGADDQEA